eukprot:scaffold23297_cov132-Cylindrotheca_fusiformis.AAC.16
MKPSRLCGSSTCRDAAGAAIHTNRVAHILPASEGAPDSNNIEAHPPAASYDTLLIQNHSLVEQLRERYFLVSSLKKRVTFLENTIIELRRLPTGNVSHIPVDDMIKIMQEYGSEVSDQTLPRKSNIKKSSTIRQFRRWNPSFFNYFVHIMESGFLNWGSKVN